MGEWEGHAIMTPALSRLLGVIFVGLVVLHSVIHKNFIQCIVVSSLIVAIHTTAYLVRRYIEKTKDDIKAIFKSFKLHHYIYVDTVSNCIILNNKGKLTKAQFKDDELVNIEFTTDKSLLESFKNKLNAFDTSDVLAYKAGRLICNNYEVYKDIDYVDNAVTLNKLKSLRERLINNTDGLDTLGRDVYIRPESPTDIYDDTEILITMGLYIILYIGLAVAEILGFM